MKVLRVFFPPGRASETWRVCDQAALAALLRGGSLAPAAAPHERVTALKALECGDYTFVPSEAAQGVPTLHNVTLAFDPAGGRTSEPLRFRKLRAAHLDDKLRQLEAVGLAESLEDARARRDLITEFSDMKSDTTYWLVPAEESLRSLVRSQVCCFRIAAAFICRL